MCSNTRYRLLGMTLLECMLALALSTMLITAAWQGYAALRLAEQSVMERSQLYHEARHALTLMRQHVAMAGYTAWDQAALRQQLPSRRLQGDNQSLRLQYHNVRSDCLNQRSTGALNDMRFYVARADVAQLYCQSFLASGVQTQPIARGVQELALRYLVAQQWRTAAPTDGSAVQAVELCLVLAAEEQPNALTAAWQTRRPTCARTHAHSAAHQFAPDLPRAPGDLRRWLRLSAVVATPNLAPLAWPP